MAWTLDKGKFVKQWYINFPDDIEFYGWIFIKDNNKLTSGYRFKYPDGDKHFYTMKNEADYSELSKLKEALDTASEMIAKQANVEVSVLEFPEEMSLKDQLKQMEELGIIGQYTKDEWEEMNKKETGKREEIKELEKLWGKGEEMTSKEDISSIAWLCDRINEWAEANNERNRVVEFFGSFWVMNPEKEFEFEEDRVFAYGIKDNILLSLKEMTKVIKREKEDFVNW